MLRFLLSKSTHTNHSLLNIYLDCKGALKWLWSLWRQVKNKTDHCRIIRGLSTELKSLNVQLSAVHVSAHLDDTKTWDELSLVERANCTYDSLAKRILRKAN